MSEDSDPTLWRDKYHQCVHEAEAAQRDCQELEGLLCKAISRLILAVEGLDPELDARLETLDAAVREGVDRDALKVAISALTDVTVHRGVDGAGPRPGTELSALLQRLEVPEALAEAFADLQRRVQGLHDPAALPDLIDELAALWQRHAESDSQPPDTRVCALLISEVLHQLLEHLSLPADLSERLGRLRESLEHGVEAGTWDDLLAEVSGMVTDIRAKIHQERLGTERFLKQVSERLQELDSHFRVTESDNARQLRESEELDMAVRKEFQGLEASVQEEQDIDGLKYAVTRRLEAISLHMETYRETEQDRHDRTAQKVRELSQRLAEMEQETQQLRSRLRKERLHAMIDPLTGIPNRLAYEERIKQEVGRWQRFKHPLALIVWDIDHFKHINDTYGHQAGDNALKNIAKLMVKTIRQTDFIARYGGEEFVMVMPGASQNSAYGVAEKLRELVAATRFRFRGEPVTITISCGVAEFHDGDTPESVFARADEGLYHAKENGRNQTVLTG